jgi:cobalamin biosynthesis Mg chelatase CobN
MSVDMLDVVVLEDAPEPPPPSALSAEMQALLLQMQAQTIAAMMEMKKPSAEEQEKIDAQKSRDRERHRATVRAGQAAEAQQAAVQASCSHSKPNGKTSFTGQVNSDNCYRLFCPICRYISKPIHATPEQIANGLNLHVLDASRFTISALEAAAAVSQPPDPIRTIPLGYVADNAGL